MVVDPGIKRFSRVHRCNLIAACRVMEIAPFANEDGMITLKGGQVVRLSRNRGESLRAKIFP